VEAKAWQAFYATLLLERSKFGLNELLGRRLLLQQINAVSNKDRGNKAQDEQQKAFFAHVAGRKGEATGHPANNGRRDKAAAEDLALRPSRYKTTGDDEIGQTGQ